jgi:hypothetical protein
MLTSTHAGDEDDLKPFNSAALLQKMVSAGGDGVKMSS